MVCSNRLYIVFCIFSTSAGYSTSVLILVIMGCVVLVISIVSWVAVAFQAGLQDSKVVVTI